MALILSIFHSLNRGEDGSLKSENDIIRGVFLKVSLISLGLTECKIETRFDSHSKGVCGSNVAW